MPDLTLSFVSNFNERVERSWTEPSKPTVSISSPPILTLQRLFWRQLKFQEFEVAEMSMSSYLIARSRGVDMIAIRFFRAAGFSMRPVLHADSGVKQARRPPRQAHRRRRVPADRRALGARACWTMTCRYVHVPVDFVLRHAKSWSNTPRAQSAAVLLVLADADALAEEVAGLVDAGVRHERTGRHGKTGGSEKPESQSVHPLGERAIK